MSEPKKILIIDDEQDFIDITEELLSGIGELLFLSANNGLKGLEIAKDSKPDLIILDLLMPEMNGFMVFKKLKKDAYTRDIPVIILTGITEKQGITYDAKSMGNTFGVEPEAYIDKPFEAEELIKIVSKLLNIRPIT